MSDEPRRPDPDDPTELTPVDPEATAEGGAPPAWAFEQTELPGTPIGRYTLQDRIGEGGFGAVYRAEQVEPVRRTVALKIIKLGMDTRDVIGRFEAERQTLALMDHPGIARVLDAGATDSGRPFFVMEYVDGPSITHYCDAHRLALRERLELFRQICGAVHHAHQKGIIHRDIKPSNILVATVDGRPVPKVIDFGIAKATERTPGEGTMFTQLGQVIGTPAYMSPEQADPRVLDIDTRSDIYSLGVVLYELLTGTTPIDVTTMRRAAFDEVRRLIREEEPARPSTRLATLGDKLPDVARLRGLDSRKLSALLKGDLDWVIMKALDKDRTRRYDSAADFAHDIERFLTQQPVSAGPPSARYRMRKFVGRHRAAVGVATAAVLTLAVFAVTMAVQAKRIAAERDRATQEREISDRVVEFQAHMLQRIDPESFGGSLIEGLRERVSDSARASFDASLASVNPTDAALDLLDAQILTPALGAIEDEFGDEPALAARLHHALAATYRALGLFDEALPQIERAYRLRLATLGPRDRETLRSQSLNAMILWDLGRFEESGEILEAAIPVWEEAFGSEDPLTLTARMCLGVLMMDRGEQEEAERTLREVLAIQERILGPDDEKVGLTLSNLGVALLNQKKYDEATPVFERALALRRAALGEDHAETMFALQRVAQVYGLQGRLDEAVAMQQQAIDTLERVRGEKHRDTIGAYASLAALYKNAGKFREAIPAAREALARNREFRGEDHPETLAAINELGILNGNLGRFDEAEPLFLEAWEKARAVLGPDQAKSIDYMNNVAVVRWYQGRFQEAEPLFVEALASARRRFGDENVATTGQMNNLAILYTKLGRPDEARALLDEAMTILTREYGEKHRETLATRASLASLTYSMGQLEESRELYAALVEDQRETLGEDHPLTLASIYNLGVVLGDLDRNEEAVALLEDMLPRRRQALGETHDETLDTVLLLAERLATLERMDEARPLFEEVIAARRADAVRDDATPGQLHTCALILLTVPIESLRAPDEALALALRANEATGGSEPGYLDTLARAYAETGQRALAVETQKRALTLLPAEAPDRSGYEERLAGYRAAS